MPTEEETRLEGLKEVGGREGASIEPAPGPTQICKENHNLHIQDIPTLNATMSSPSIGTPYSSLPGPPFEYPFPSPKPIATPPYPHQPLPVAGSFPFLNAPSLAQRGHYSAAGASKVSSIALGFPVWRRKANSTNTMFALTTAPPPVPPRLRKQKDDKDASSADDTDHDTAPQVVVTHGEQSSDTGAQSGGEAPVDRNET